MTNENTPTRRRPDWWALDPAVTHRDEPGRRVGARSRVTNHYTVEVTRDVNHLPHQAADELGIRIEHKLNEVVDDYDRVHTDVEQLTPLFDDTRAGRKLANQTPL